MTQKLTDDEFLMFEFQNADFIRHIISRKFCEYYFLLMNHASLLKERTLMETPEV